MTEQELIQRCLKGDWQAREALYQRNAARLYRLLLRMTGCPEDAADLIQETFIKAFRSLSRFDGRASVDTWLHRIAVNEALQCLRRQQRGARALQQVSRRQANPVENPDDRLDLEAALTQMPQTDRAILVLRYQQELDYARIAEVLDIRPGTVASRLNRARGRLRTLLGAEPPIQNPPIQEESATIEHPNKG